MLRIVVSLLCFSLMAMDGKENEESSDHIVSDDDSATQLIDFDELNDPVIVRISIEGRMVFQTLVNKDKIYASRKSVKIHAGLTDNDINSLPDQFNMEITLFGGEHRVRIVTPFKKADISPILECQEEALRVPFDCGAFAKVISNVPKEKPKREAKAPAATKPKKKHFFSCF